jgi:hypothetical protein
MKIAKTTKERIAHIKAEANTPKQRLMELMARLEEHAGTKAICRGLGDVIGRLEAWQNTRT